MDEFELLAVQAKELFKALPEQEFKTIAAFTLIIGWLLTASSAQEFVAANAQVSKFGSVLALGGFVIIQTGLLWGHYQKIKNIHARLTELAVDKGFSQVVVDTYRVSPFLPVVYALINIIFCIVIIVLVFTIAQV